METTSPTLSPFDLLSNAITSDKPTEKCTELNTPGTAKPYLRICVCARMPPSSECNQRDSNTRTYLHHEH